jgi:hypothetical protein
LCVYRYFEIEYKYYIELGSVAWGIKLVQHTENKTTWTTLNVYKIGPVQCVRKWLKVKQAEPTWTYILMYELGTLKCVKNGSTEKKKAMWPTCRRVSP